MLAPGSDAVGLPGLAPAAFVVSAASTTAIVGPEDAATATPPSSAVTSQA